MNTSNVTHESARRGWFFVRLLDCLFRPFYWVDRPVGSRRKLSYIWPEQCSKIRLELAIPCCPRYLKVNHWNLGMICFALMAEVFVLRAVCFGKGYGALKRQKQTNERTKYDGSLLLRRGRWIWSWSQKFPILLFPTPSSNSSRYRTHKLAQQSAFLFVEARRFAFCSQNQVMYSETHNGRLP